MWNTNNWDKPTLQSLISEESGKGSSSRLLSAIVVLTALLWGTIVVIHTKAIPDLGSLAVFVSSVVGVLYGINKVSSAASDAVISINKKDN